MKKLLRVLSVLVLVFSSAALFAQSGDANWDSIYEPGDFLLSASAGIAVPFAFAVYPGAEYMIYQLSALPIDFGVAARGQFAFFSSNLLAYGWMSFGAGAFGTAHISFKNAEDFVAPWLENFDFYVSLGFALNYFTYTGNLATIDTQKLRPGFASFEGVNWFFAENVALKLEYAYWGYVGSQATVGIQYRF